LVDGQIGEKRIAGLMEVVKNGEKIGMGCDARNYLNGLGEVGSQGEGRRVRSI